MSRRYLFLLISVFLIALAASGCGRTNDTGDDITADEVLVVALTSEPTNLSPVFLDINAGNWKVFNGLMKFDAQLNLVPDLAAEMPQVSADGRTVTVRLREGVRFHDGMPLTAEDVVFTWESIQDTRVASPVRSVMATDSLESVEAVDELTVRFHLNRSDPAFIEKLYVGIVPKHLLEGQDLNQAAFNRAPVGTGPYKFVEWVPGDRLVFEANEDYFAGPVGDVKRIVFTFVPDESARLAMLQDGTIDYTRLSPPSAAQLSGDSRFNVYNPPSASIHQVALPSSNPVLSDPVVRRAIAMAIDRQRIVDTLLGGMSKPAYGPILEGHWAYDPDTFIPYDVEGAKALLEGAGWVDTNGDGVREKDGQRLAFTMMYLSNNPEDRDISLVLRSDLAQIGIDVSVEGVSSPGYADRLGTDAFMHGVGLPYDPDYILWSRYHSSYATSGGSDNPARLANPEVDAALEDARNATSQAERAEAYIRLQKALLEDGSYVFLTQRPFSVAVSSRFEGIQPKMMGSPHAFVRGVFWNVEEWTLR